jgi:hypothetical protein
MAELTKSNVMAFKEEVSEGTLIDIATGSEFVPLRDGFAFAGAVETIDSDELVAGDIGASKSFVTKEAPTGSYPKYLKHSGVEGQAPEYSILIKSAMGSQVDNATEYSTTAGSVAGTDSIRASLEMGGDEDNFAIGQGTLIKDGVNGYSIRNVQNVDSAGDQLDLNYNLSAAPASGVGLGKAIAFKGSTTHPTFSAHHYQSAASSAYYQAMAGCRTSSMSFSFPALGFAEATFEFGGIEFFLNPIRITAATNDNIDFTDDVGTVAATLSPKVYKTPIELADEVAAKMTAASVGSGNDTITCTYSSTTGKFTIATDGATLSLLWLSGTNTATSAKTALGFDNVDETGALTYDSDSAQTYNPSVTPAYDSSDNLVIKGNELMIGSFEKNICVKATEANFTIDTPKTDVPSLCAASGTDSSIILERTATFTANLILQEHEVQYFNDMINNVTTQLMFNLGPKSAGNWVAGKCMNIWYANASITATPIQDQDGYQIVALEASGFVSGSHSDVYVNFL